MPTFVAFFRGINVGGNHQVKMADLTALHEVLGFTRVRPYIQSGNVIFTSEEVDAEQLGARIEERFEHRFDFLSQVYLRTASEMQAIVERNPFQGQPGKEGKWIVVTFLPAHINAAAWDELIQAYPGPEEVIRLGNELFIYYGEGIGRSRLPTTPLGKQLKTVGTARNWNTLLKVLELMRE